jgi:hypothetical protein
MLLNPIAPTTEGPVESPIKVLLDPVVIELAEVPVTPALSPIPILREPLVTADNAALATVPSPPIAMLLVPVVKDVRVFAPIPTF